MQSSGPATERDADAIVTWLRTLKAYDYARKPADGLRRQVIKVISLQQAASPAAATTPSDSDPAWSIDPRPEPSNSEQSDQHGLKRPLNGAAASAALSSKAARMAGAASPANGNGVGRTASDGAGGGGFNMLNASLRASMASNANSPGPAAEAADAAAGVDMGVGGASLDPAAVPNGQDAGGKSTSLAASGRQRPNKRERRAEKGGGNSADGSGAAGGAAVALGYANLGGMDEVLQQVRELVEYPLMHPEIYAHLGVEPPRGVLLHGPPGCGKTLLATAIAGELGVTFMRISAPEVVSGMSGESEAKIRSLFREAAEAAPAMIFIDEIDAIAPKRETAQREMERRIVAQLLTCMDELNFAATGGQSVIVMGATNRPDAMDPALRRAGRFDREIALGIPDAAARERILLVMCKGMRLSGDLDLGALAKRCNGYVGADLAALCKEAAVVAVNRIFGNLFGVVGAGSTPAASSAAPAELPAPAEAGEAEPAKPAMTAAEAASAARHRQKAALSPEALAQLAIGLEDFEAGLAKVQPSAQREGFATVPDVNWEDVGALGELRGEMQMAIVQPILTPERFEALGLKPSCGVLLHGPPGCGKTLLAKAIANESGASFISVKGPELLNKFVGESERAVRALFARGRASAPCVVFFDELDALVPRRGGDSSSQASERVVNQMLTEMDGLDGNRQVFVVAATNRPDMIDPAMLRPGRLDKLVYVPLPNAAGRLDILRTATRAMPLDETVSLDAITSDPRCVGFSGADLSALAREAAVAALKLCPVDEKPIIGANHFEAAFERVQPSVSPKDEQNYKRLAQRLRGTRATAKPDAGGANDAKPTGVERGGGGGGDDAGSGQVAA